MNFPYRLIFLPIAIGISLCSHLPVFAQTPSDCTISPALLSAEVDSFTVKHIFIEGNKITKDRIILRELSFDPGDKIPREGLPEMLEQERNRIFNTNLFTLVTLQLNPLQGDSVALFITVNEELYILPIPIFEIADRNFTVWWANQNRSFKRLNYGLDLQLRNFRGRREKIKTKVKLGFTKSINLDYEIPYINKAQTNGLRFRGKYSENRAIAINTVDNIQEFWPPDSIPKDQVLWKQYYAGVTFTRRKNFFLTHFATLAFNQDVVGDSVIKFNPNYLSTQGTRQRYVVFEYEVTYDRRDIQSFPLKGNYLSVKLEKKGLGVFRDTDITEIRTRLGKFVPLGGSFYWSSALNTKVTFTPSALPYIESRALGFSQFYVRGFDRLVMEGEHAILNRNNVRFKLLDTNIDFGKFMPIKQFNKIPFRIYPKLFVDWGKSWNSLATPENGDLYNRTLSSIGIGVDMMTAYGRVLRIEYAIHTIPTLDAGLRGVFISFDSDF